MLAQDRWVPKGEIPDEARYNPNNNRSMEGA